MDKRLELRKRINDENGINFHRNVNLSGYIIYRRDSFIAFHFKTINGITGVVIDYIAVVNKTDLIKLLSFCINFWAGSNTKFIYLREHVRASNIVEKYFKTLGFDIMKSDNATWKHTWTSTNGYSEGEIIEAFL